MVGERGERKSVSVAVVAAQLGERCDWQSTSVVASLLVTSPISDSIRRFAKVA